MTKREKETLWRSSNFNEDAVNTSVDDRVSACHTNNKNCSIAILNIFFIFIFVLMFR